MNGQEIDDQDGGQVKPKKSKKVSKNVFEDDDDIEDIQEIQSNNIVEVASNNQSMATDAETAYTQKDSEQMNIGANLDDVDVNNG